MRYPLAKQLKEAHFRDDIYLYEKSQEVGNAPKVTEIMLACTGTVTLCKISETQWVARDEAGREGHGEEADEAAAYLWFAQKEFNDNTHESEASE